MLNDRTCTHCEYMRNRNAHGGWCCRYPPSVHVAYIPAGQEVLTQFDNLRPWVEHNDLCGEFSRSMPSLMSMMNEQKE